MRLAALRREIGTRLAWVFGNGPAPERRIPAIEHPPEPPAAASLPDPPAPVEPLRDPLDTWVIAVMDGGRRLWVDLGDYGVSRPCMTGVYEPSETAFVAATLKPGDVFLDIGANIGWFTILAASIVGPTGRVLAFEPRPNSCARLAMSVAENGYTNVEVAAVAVGDMPGRLTVAALISARNPGGTWSLATTALDTGLREGHERFEVDVVRIDDLALDRCDLIKIDIEGAEKPALTGAAETIRRLRPLILTEINPECLLQVSEIGAEEYVAFVERLGYRAWTLGEAGVGEPLPEGFAAAIDGCCNVVFVPVEP